jgi:hypothetical protein
MTSDNNLPEGAQDTSDLHLTGQSDPQHTEQSDEVSSDLAASDPLIDVIKDDRKEGGPPPFDPSEFFTADGGSSQQFDEFLKAFDEEQPQVEGDEEFGTLKESQIAKGVSGLLPPELGGDTLEADEVAFGISAGELQTIVRTLSLMLRFQPQPNRRCRIVITPDGVAWHGNQGNGFIEYFTSGSPTNLSPGSTRTLIVALNDLKSAARGTREGATFRIRNDTIYFTADRFRRPIMTFSPRSFPTHTDALLQGVDLSAPRPEVSSSTIGTALAFLGTIAPSDEEAPLFNIIQIKDSIARASRLSIAAQVEATAFDGLDIAFRPHFLRWLLPALKLRANFQAWHSDKFCVIKNDNLTFGFELIPHELTDVPTKRVTDTLLIPAAQLVTFVERAVRMLKDKGMLTILSDERGMGPVVIRADDGGQTPREISAKLDANRDGKSLGPMKVSEKAHLWLKALRATSSDANVELAVAGNAVFLERTQNDAKYFVMLAAKVKQ